MKPFMIYFPRHRHLQYIIQDNYQKESQKLDLTCCPNEWEQVLQFRKWSKLKFLSLVNCGIHPNKMNVVAKYYWANLEQLYLTRNNIGAEGIKMLVKSHTPKLKVLILTKCKIGDEGVNHLTKNCWQNLAVLNLIGNCITIDGFMKLQKGSFEKIKSIIMSLNDVNVDWISVMTAFIYDSKQFYLKKHIENDLMMQRFFEIEKQRLHLVPLYAYNQV